MSWTHFVQVRYLPHLSHAKDVSVYYWWLKWLFWERITLFLLHSFSCLRGYVISLREKKVVKIEHKILNPKDACLRYLNKKLSSRISWMENRLSTFIIFYTHTDESYFRQSINTFCLIFPKSFFMFKCV